jgi:hypothetical protein
VGLCGPAPIIVTRERYSKSLAAFFHRARPDGQIGLLRTVLPPGGTLRIGPVSIYQTVQRNCPKRPGRACSLALRAGRKEPFSPFHPLYPDRIRAWSVLEALFGQFH